MTLNSNEIIKKLDMPNGQSLVLLDRLAKEAIYGREACARNVYLIGNEGQVVWQIKTNFDADGDPFTNIFFDDNGKICGYRWDGCQYMVDLMTGQAIPSALLK